MTNSDDNNYPVPTPETNPDSAARRRRHRHRHPRSRILQALRAIFACPWHPVAGISFSVGTPADRRQEVGVWLYVPNFGRRGKRQEDDDAYASDCTSCATYGGSRPSSEQMASSDSEADANPRTWGDGSYRTTRGRNGGSHPDRLSDTSDSDADVGYETRYSSRHIR